MEIKKLIMLFGLCTTLGTVGCASNSPRVGGSAGGANATNAGHVERCQNPLGTVAIIEDTNEDWYRQLRKDYKLSSTIPLLRLMVQQSNCFVVVERGKGMKAMSRERDLMNSGEMRGGSNFGKGQMVAADFGLSPSINFSEDSGGMGGMLGGLMSLNRNTKAFAGLAGGVKFKEASTTLLLVDNRSGVQLAAAEGNASKTDFKAWGGLFGRSSAGLGGYTKTPEGKVIAGAFADAFNQMVLAVKDYRAQEVEGGLGKGGKLKVGN
ncbi:MAG: CsgG/HfaB family protein [Chromatiales bacterium]|nr:CsgG/HfaB family protein [Chromatiales bacterium]